MPTLHTLRRSTHPEFNDYVVHFTARSGGSKRPEEIEHLPPAERLRRIIGGEKILGFEIFGTKARAVCFTGCTARGVRWLLKDRRYAAYGLAFTRDYVLARGGGPVLEVRGDEWPLMQEWPEQLRARAIRYWPGETPDPGENLAWYRQDESNWTAEREWRVPCLGDAEGFEFDLADVGFLVLPSPEVRTELIEGVDSYGDDAMSATVRDLSYILLNADGEIIGNVGVVLRDEDVGAVTAPPVG